MCSFRRVVPGATVLVTSGTRGVAGTTIFVRLYGGDIDVFVLTATAEDPVSEGRFGDHGSHGNEGDQQEQRNCCAR